jgi:hypothetical protein
MKGQDELEMIDKLVDQIAFDETKRLLVDLAINFTSKTKIQAAPIGTRSWIVEKYDEHSSQRLKTIVIPLYPFFGMYVGYNSEVDILVIWHF